MSTFYIQLFISQKSFLSYALPLVLDYKEMYIFSVCKRNGYNLCIATERCLMYKLYPLPYNQ